MASPNTYWPKEDKGRHNFDNSFRGREIVDLALYRSKSAPRATSPRDTQTSASKYHFSKLPVASKEVLNQFGRAKATMTSRRSDQISSQRDRIREAIVASTSEHRILQAQHSSPSPSKTIGEGLPDSVRRDIRLPFIQMKKVGRDKVATRKFLMSNETSRSQAIDIRTGATRLSDGKLRNILFLKKQSKKPASVA